ncbi:MAG: hypothetical protein EOM28_03180 [Clostridia bacterium]|nr:hypothetical protein [Clostridia bacterium]
MRKVDVNLIEELNRGAENQGKPKGEFVVTYTAAVTNKTYYFDRGHNVPAGKYVVKLIDIKCVGVYFYKLTVEVLFDNQKSQVITGLANKNEYSFRDLADCFSNGVLHKSPDLYVGSLGIISINEMGYISLIDRTATDRVFQG